MSYYGKSLYLDFNTLPKVDHHRFTLGRILARGTSATIYHGVDREAGKCNFDSFPLCLYLLFHSGISLNFAKM